MRRHATPNWCIGRPLSGEAGMGLVDVMVALIIGSIALLSLAAVIPLASSASQQGWQESRAAAIAEDLFEQMRVTAYANVNSTTFPNETAVTGYQGFSYTLTFADNTPVSSTRQVTVTVSYMPVQGGGLSGPMNVSFTTIFAAPAT
jgi:type IV pilus modification protein PilV